MKWTSTYTRLSYFILILIAIWAFTRRSPALFDTFDRMSKVVESSGGKILVLAIMAMLFFSAAMGFAYYVIDGIQAHTLATDDVMANMMVQFVTGTAFGTVIGALVSLLGGKSEPKP